MLMVLASLALVAQNTVADKHKHGYVKIKVWRGPSHGHKKHKYAPFGYKFSIDEKGH